MSKQLKSVDMLRMLDTKSDGGVEDQMDTMKASIYGDSSQAASDKKINLVVKDKNPHKTENRLAVPHPVNMRNDG